MDIYLMYIYHTVKFIFELSQVWKDVFFNLIFFNYYFPSNASFNISFLHHKIIWGKTHIEKCGENVNKFLWWL